jgi:hypothetical protein
MARPRSAAGIAFTTSLPMAISPPVMGSSPAIIRRSVDLPQPEGPTKTQNSPCSTCRSMPLMTSTAP